MNAKPPVKHLLLVYKVGYQPSLPTLSLVVLGGLSSPVLPIGKVEKILNNLFSSLKTTVQIFLEEIDCQIIL